MVKRHFRQKLQQEGRNKCLREIVQSAVKNSFIRTNSVWVWRKGRVVFVNEKLRKELQQYIRFYTPADVTMKFFYSQKKESNGFSSNSLTGHFHYLYRRAGINGASSHSGRRSFITNLASKGVSVRVLMSLAGHRSISTTQAYIDINDNMLRSAVELA